MLALRSVAGVCYNFSLVGIVTINSNNEKKDTMNKLRHISVSLVALGLIAFLASCSVFTAAKPAQKQPTVAVAPSFQAQMSPAPTFPPYVCGAWSSNNAPGPYTTITIYARLTHNVRGVSGATATATVHFQYGDVTLGTQPLSDNGGYVSFILPLAGRQPAGVPATVSVTFSGVPGYSKAVDCTQAFFTPA